METYAIILARGGSKGIPNKNIQLLCGKPLIHWTISAAVDSERFSRIIVSTDSNSIAAAAKESGADVPFIRPAHLSGDDATSVDALEHCFQHEGITRGTCVLLQPTSPLRTCHDITRALDEFTSSSRETLISVHESKETLHKSHSINEQGYLSPLSPLGTSINNNRQLLPKSFVENGFMYVFDVETFRNSKPSKIGGVYSLCARPFFTDERDSVDIDTEDDLSLAQKILGERLSSEALPFVIGDRLIGPSSKPFVVAEIGINHEGDINKAKKMVDDAFLAGAECVKFQCHVCEDEMTAAAGEVVPGNAEESILTIMERCALSKEDDIMLKEYAESKGMIFMSTPFSRAAADQLNSIGVQCYKIGSGECNNYPLVEHIASFGKPIILSTGMNDIASISPAVDILRKSRVPFALLHCTSMYPTPYDKVRLGGIGALKDAFPDAIIGLSDHSLGNWTCFAAVPLGACILEKHFTSDKNWPGPDIPISIDTCELKDLVDGCNAISQALGGEKDILIEEKPTIDFAYACVVSIKPIMKGEILTSDNIWVKRPGTGEIFAKDYENVLGKTALSDINTDVQLTWGMFS